MNEVDLRQLEEVGLILNSLNHVSYLEFEPPVKINNVRCLGKVSIGLFSYVGPGSEIKNTQIGRFCSIAGNVTLGPPEHPVDWISTHPFQYDGLRWYDDFKLWDKYANKKMRFEGNSQKTIIGNDVWIGRGAIIRQGVKVGNGVIIGANTFVNKDLPDYCIAVGTPARIIKYRFNEENIRELLAIKWWEYVPVMKTNNLNYNVIDKFIIQFKKGLENGSINKLELKSFILNRENNKSYMAIK